MTAPSGRKIRKLSLRVRLVSSEGRKIAQFGSLARWKMFNSRPSEGGRVFRFLSPAARDPKSRDPADDEMIWK